MLRELLSIMAGGGLLSEAELARKLGTSLPALGGMLGQLRELGYVEELGASLAEDCSAAASSVPAGACRDGASSVPWGATRGACRGCPMAGSCHGGAKVYGLTAKGRAAASA